MELDVYIEALNLAFEYQGQQHYYPIHWIGKSLKHQQSRDQEKKVACKKVSIHTHTYSHIL